MEFRELVIEENQIKNLYEMNHWFAYTKDLPKLIEGIKSSLKSIGAYHNDSLVGLIRVVGDGNTIIYIQDLLVLPEYQGQGIGTRLMKMILDEYVDVRQKILSTDNLTPQKHFYESLGFVEYDDMEMKGFIFKERKE